MTDSSFIDMTVLESRLRPPSAPAIELTRPLLRERLRAALAPASAVLLLCTPAGYGKSQALRQLHADLLAEGQLVAWLSVESHLNDAARFHLHFAAALAVAGIELSPGTNLNEMRIALCNFAERSSRPITLFIDQLESLSDAAALAFMEALLGSAGSTLRIALAGRRAPLLRIGGLMAAGRLTSLGVDELTFSFGETGEFLSRAVSEPLGVTGLNVAYETSEGWPAALKILVQQEYRGDGLERRLHAGRWPRVETEAYIEQEILLDLDAQERAVMDVLCLVEAADAQLLETILGTPVPISRLAARNSLLMVVPRVSAYRLHPLVRLCLRGQFIQADPHRYATYCRRLGSHFRAIGDAALGIDYLIDGGDLDAAIDMLESEGREMALNGFPDRCLNWLARLPRERCANHPGLMLAEAWARAAMHDIGIALKLLQQAQMFKSSIQEPMFALEIELALAMAYAIADQPEATRASIDRIAEVAADVSPDIRSGRACSLAWLAFSQGNLEQGLAELFGSACLAEAGQGLLFHAYASVIAAECYVGSGRVDSAEAECRRALKLVEQMRGRGSMLAGVILGPLVDALYEADRIDEAIALCAGRTELVLRFPMPGAVTAGPVMLARALCRRGAQQEAKDLLERMTRLGQARRVPRVTALALSCRIEAAIAEGRHAEVPPLFGQLVALRRGNDGLGTPQGVVNYLARLAEIRVQLAGGDGNAAFAQIKRLHDELAAGPWRRLQVQVGALRAVQLWIRGEQDSAVSLMSNVLGVAASLGLVRSVADELDAAPDLLARTVADLRGHEAYLQRLTAAITVLSPEVISIRPVSSGEQEQSLFTDESGFTARERDILYLIERGLAAKHIARTLGISHQTAKWHLKNVYQKLGVHSKASAVDAIRKLHSKNSH